MARARLILSLLGLAALACAGPAAAQDDFYKGKTVEIIVGFGPGGGYDTYARALGQFLPKHLPGQPTVIVKNMPGAGSLTLVNYLVNIAPKDGTSFGTFDQSLILAPLFGGDAAKFDASKLSWVGSIAKGNTVCITWHTAEVKSWDDLTKKKAVFGGTGREDVRYTHAAMLRNMFGADLKIVTGYKGSSDLRIAMERGEIDGTCGDSWTSLKSTAADWVRDKKINILVQFALDTHPDVRDVPLLTEKARTDEDRAALKLLFAAQVAGRPFAGPPGVPAERLAVLRAAFDATMKDPEFLAFTERARLEVDAVGGRAIEALVGEVYQTPPAVIARAKAVRE
ncbi:MAG TPA: tripartite tricarboxylate transporter substrate-binding protein [Beijerinckiaceae bacterium]|nr:tripartite tricarboxylate transporter substrate-binding protein [Beijerinckiaceae bacterium]